MPGKIIATIGLPPRRNEGILAAKRFGRLFWVKRHESTGRKDYQGRDGFAGRRAQSGQFSQPAGRHGVSQRNGQGDRAAVCGQADHQSADGGGFGNRLCDGGGDRAGRADGVCKKTPFRQCERRAICGTRVFVHAQNDVYDFRQPGLSGPE